LGVEWKINKMPFSIDIYPGEQLVVIRHQAPFDVEDIQKYFDQILSHSNF